MPKTSKKRRLDSNRKAGKRKPVKKRAKFGQPTDVEEAAFTESLIESGEAARLDSQGKLRAGATHKIVKGEAGDLKVVRRRFSIA